MAQVKPMSENSVYIDNEKCTGCTTCVKACPTQAIRVIRGKAVMKDALCIDCGRCVTVCPHHAKGVLVDSFDKLADYDYNVALPTAALFGQFHNLTDINIVLEGLLRLGFDDVYDVSAAAEMYVDYWKSNDYPILEGTKPRLTPFCPALLRLIVLRFSDVIDNVIPVISPIELAAIAARKEAAEKTGLPPARIGVCYIAPCPAEISMAKYPGGLEKPVIDYCLPMSEVYVKLLAAMKQVENPRHLLRSGRTGLQWSRSGGISATLGKLDAMGADGIENVMSILEDIEDGRLTEAELVELDCCTQSCYGGCLCVENPYTAKMRMKKLTQSLPETRCAMPQDLVPMLGWTQTPESSHAARYSRDIGEALRIQAEAGRVLGTLPSFDCGSCGAPTCAAFAEDVAQGLAQAGDCIYNIIKKMRNKEKEDEVDEFLPPPFRKPIAKPPEDKS